MDKEDSLRFVQDRLRHNHSLFDARLLRRPRVTRRFVAEMARGEAQRFENVDGSVIVNVVAGTLWITHDGDPKDLILVTGESYQADRQAAMNVYAIDASLLEIQFEDDLVEH